MMGAKLLGVQVDADTLAGADTFGAVLDSSPRDAVSPLWASLFAVTWICDGELVATIDDRGRLTITDERRNSKTPEVVLQTREVVLRTKKPAGGLAATG